MDLTIKLFAELSTSELYEILKSRAQIFVVEQNCVYQDLDDVDKISTHFFYQNGSGLIEAYLRVFPISDMPGCVQIGRVLTLHHGSGLGGELLHQTITYLKKNNLAHTIFLDAQVYAKGFYEQENFQICSDEFLEDGIPHVRMRLTLV